MLTMRFISLYIIVVRKEYLAKINNCPTIIGRGPLRRRAQYIRIGCTGLRPALTERSKTLSTTPQLQYPLFIII